jgi:hypothetical protein
LSSRRPSKLYSLLRVAAGCHGGPTASIYRECLFVGQVCVQNKYAFICQGRCICSVSVGGFLVDIFNPECVCQWLLIRILSPVIALYHICMALPFIFFRLSRLELSTRYTFPRTSLFLPSPYAYPLSCQSPDPPTKRQPNHITQLMSSPP